MSRSQVQRKRLCIACCLPTRFRGKVIVYRIHRIIRWLAVALVTRASNINQVITGTICCTRRGFRFWLGRWLRFRCRLGLGLGRRFGIGRWLRFGFRCRFGLRGWLRFRCRLGLWRWRRVGLRRRRTYRWCENQITRLIRPTTASRNESNE